jgi:transposase InsO family protein
VVRRILSVHFRPASDGSGPSWLTFLGHAKNSLWSCDLFRCESATLKTQWVLVVMDQFTRRIIGFGVHRGLVEGTALCRMLQRAIRGHGLPEYLSSDHDPLYRFHQWQANLRVLGVTEIKTVPYVPWSHPFVERLIGTIRRELLDRTLFLDHGRSGNETHRFPALLQCSSHACWAKAVAAEDVARVIAGLLANPQPHIGKIYHLTGPQSENMHFFAQEYSKALGRTITFQDIPVEPWRDELLKRGWPVHVVNHLAAMGDLHRAGRFDRMSDDVLTLTGQRPLSVQEFVKQNAAAFTVAAKAREA